MLLFAHVLKQTALQYAKYAPHNPSIKPRNHPHPNTPIAKIGTKTAKIGTGGTPSSSPPLQPAPRSSGFVVVVVGPYRSVDRSSLLLVSLVVLDIEAMRS